MVSAKTIQQVFATLKSKKYTPVYFLQGSEVYYIDQIVNYIEDHALTGAEKSFNLRCYYGKEHPINDVLGRARCLPMLGKQQVIIVKEAQEMSDLQCPKGQRLLLQYLEKANVQTLLVFAYKYKTLKSKAVLEALQKHGHTLFSTPKVYERQISSWLEKYVTKQGYTITTEAKLLLQSLLGTDLLLLSSELKKLMLSVSTGGKITEVLVKKHIGMQRDLNSFELQRAIAARDSQKALAIVEYFSKNEKKYPIIPIVGLLTTFFLKILQLHHLGSLGANKQAEMLQVPLYFIKDYQNSTKKHTKKMVINHLQALHKADLQLKGIECPAIRSGEVLKELVVRLLGA